MFTGIVTDVGRILRVDREADGRRIRIETRLPVGEIGVGGSIATSGVCFTVVEHGEGWFEVQGSGETLACTTMGDWAEGDGVNLERSLRMGDELGGHIVFGHVDCVGEIRVFARDGDRHRLEIGIPAFLAPMVAVKGSIAVDGISLTINEAKSDAFAVNIISHTLEKTTLAGRVPGDRVNIEVDMLARYVARQTAFLRDRD
jgi:riboflavin synthase